MMQKRLRLRFLLITWGLLMLLFAMLLVGVWMYYRTNAVESETALRHVVEHFDSVDQESSLFDPTIGMAAIRVGDGGVIAEMRLSRLTLSEETAAALVKKILQSESGVAGEVFLETVNFRYIYSITESGEVHLAIAECSGEARTLAQLRQYFLGFALLGAVLSFGVSALLAHWATKPIAEAWDKQNAFVSDATHELKTPLAVINANTDAVLSNPEATVGSQARWLSSIRGETGRMAGLVADLLFIAKADAGEIKLDLEPLRISDAVEGLCMEWEVAFFERELCFDYAVTPDMVYRGDWSKIGRLTEILLDNAIKYTPSGGKVRLVMNRTRKMQLQILVSNTGEALTAQQQESVFERFYRVDGSRTRESGGYGLGLCIAKCIVAMHGGTIAASSEGGVNTFVAVLGDAETETPE